MPRLSQLFLLVVASATAAAADLKIDIQPVYSQTVPHHAFVDGRGTLWFFDKHHVHDATGKRVASGPTEKFTPFHVDAAGRCWFWDFYQRGTVPVAYSDGKTTTSTKLIALSIHDDSAGRVFVRTPKAVHVLSPKGEWSIQELFARDVWGQTAFAEDAKGRTWLWVARNRPKTEGGNVGTPGVWCFDGKGWKNHTPADGLPFEHVQMLLPLADDWFLVQEQREAFAQKPEWAAWSPSRTAKEITDAKRFQDLPTFGLGYFGTDLDGNRYLHRPRAVHDGVKQYEPGMFRVSPKGEVKQLTEAEANAIARQTKRVREPMLPILARPGEPRPVGEQVSGPDCHGRDKDGRLWFAEPYPGRGSLCLWPAKEKAGEALRMEPFAGMHRSVPRGFVLGGGEAWGVHNGLHRWDGKTWAADDPFPAFKASQWTARPSPPLEYHLAVLRRQEATPTDGGLLAARVTTKYEGAVIERFGRAPGGLEEEAKKVDPKDPMFVFLLALRDNNRWGKPANPLTVLKANVKNLIRSMKADRGEPRAVAVCSDGVRLWAAFDGKLHAIEANGDVTTVALPKSEAIPPSGKGFRDEPEVPALVLTSLLPLAENKVLAVTAAGARVATFRTTKIREIGLTEVAGAVAGVQPLSDESWGRLLQVSVPLTLQRDKAGAVWGWKAFGDALLKFDGEKFSDLKAARSPLAVTDDGVLWCPAPVVAKLPPAAKHPVSLVRVCGDAVEPFTWKPDEIEVGFVKPPKGSALIRPSEYGLLCVEAQTKPGERPVLRKRAVSESVGWSSAGPTLVVTTAGEILFSHHWGKLFE